jgi:hypothetical protein
MGSDMRQKPISWISDQVDYATADLSTELEEDRRCMHRHDTAHGFSQ